MAAVNHGGTNCSALGPGTTTVGSCDRQEDLFVNTTVPYCIVLRTEIKSYVYPIAMTPHGASSIEPSVNVAPTMQGRRKV